MHCAIVHATEPVTPELHTGTAKSAHACCGVDACCTPAESAVDAALTVAETKTASGCV
ncbi:hypothetical protein [Streptomyces sp. NPDC020377]|uniref:hypothetical protein n=1 Tax=Streptomyces sp. NPDC020377 TaxID=3365070 RepID=UPI00378C1233